MDDNEEKINSLNNQSDMFSNSWRTYITWYTVFLTANLLALTFVSSNDPISDSIEAYLNPKKLLGYSWVFFNILGMITSIAMAFSSYRTKSIIINISKNMTGDFLSPFYGLGVTAGIFNCFALAVMALVWVFYILL